MRIDRAPALVALLLGARSAMAADAASISIERASGAVGLHAALAYEWAHRDPALPRWLEWTGADPRLELGVAVWRADQAGTERATTVGVTASPMLRWSFDRTAAGRPFVDLGLGPRVWSGTHLGERHRFGTAFEFGTTLGVGLRRSGYDLFMRIEHTSNGGIRQPNTGINFVQLGLAFELGR